MGKIKDSPELSCMLFTTRDAVSVHTQHTTVLDIGHTHSEISRRYTGYICICALGWDCIIPRSRHRLLILNTP
jgi:hypothetical protein